MQASKRFDVNLLKRIQKRRPDDEYHWAKKEAKRVVRIAQNKEWMELGRSLQSDFQNNQRRFWRRVRAPKRGSQVVDKICDGNGQVIGEEDGVMERWKEYFSGLLQGGRKRTAQRKLQVHAQCMKRTALLLRKLWKP